MDSKTEIKSGREILINYARMDSEKYFNSIWSHMLLQLLVMLLRCVQV